MVMQAKLAGREALMRRLNQLAPKVDEYTAEEKFKVARDLAEEIRQRAPRGETLEYAESIDGDLLTSRPAQEQVGRNKARDPFASGIFANFIWRFLEFGTAPHNTAKGGGTALGKATHKAGGGYQHPGTAAQPHIFPTYRAMRQEIRRRIRASVNKAVREVARKK